MPLTIGLVMLLVWNLYLAVQNKTTIEFHEGVTANIKVLLAQQSGQKAPTDVWAFMNNL